MKNLQLLYSTHSQTKSANPKFLVLDANGTVDVYICTEEKLLRHNRSSGAVEELCDVLGAVSCEHLALNNDICIATEIGEVFVVNLLTKKVDEVTFCDGGIEKMSWSPDQEIVTFVTKSQNVVVMTCTYDPISEYALTDDAFGEGEFITVGWGKKETQFHGSEGKQAAKQKSDFVEPKDIAELSAEVNVTWRGDGELFAVAFLSPHGRMFKVFDKEGKLKFTSEKVNDLGTSIAWKPSGSWIALPQKFPNKCTIALFEKNGLRHREIVLPFKFEEESISEIGWSSDSDILAIGTHNQIYLYTVGNYHWYLKQFLRFDQRVVQFSWDVSVNEEKTLHVLLEDGSYFVYRWTNAVCHSLSDSIHNQATVGVIDGQSLLLTDYRNGVIPPPMSRLNVNAISGYINYSGFLATFANDEDYKKFFIVDSKNNISFYELVFENTPVGLKLQDSRLIKQLPLPENEHFNHFLWLSEDVLVMSNSKASSSEIVIFKLHEGLSHIPLEKYVCSLVASTSENVYAHCIDGSVISIGISNGNISHRYTLPEYCETVKSFQSAGKTRIAALKNNQSLYLDSERIASDVTSFFLTRNYLVFTHLGSMKFFRLKDGKIVNERKIERGGKLITIVACDSRTVLQMPRGNLETICPRVLSLEIIGEYLDNLMYGKAMDILRKQRLNLNILCDHNMPRFLENLDRFLTEITNPQWLNLFLSDLQNEDFTKTMYASNYCESTITYPEGFKIEEKIIHICKKMCEQMEKKDYNHFILPIITTYVKTGQLEKALEVIWAEKKLEKTIASGQSRAEDGLKYLLYLVDVNDLFNVALGMYDFGLVLFVANKSQKDPKEYIPFLNELKKHEENYRKFKIDEHLKRFEKALENIAKSGDEKFDEALEFIQKHKLFQKALQAYETTPECYQKIALAFGDSLRAQGCLENASIMYERGGDLTQGILSAKNGLDWRRCLALTRVQSGGDHAELVKIAMSLVSALQENGKHDDAFYLQKTFGGEFEQALNTLMRGKLYLKAIYEARMNNPELIESKVIPDLLVYKELLTSSLQADRELFVKHKTRLQTVRELKLRQNDDDAFDNDIDECDLLSDTTSMHSSRYSGSSSRTGKTFRSSKNRRKHERKLLSLKEGNAFEDIALIDALHNQITKVANQQEHIRDTCKSLLEIACDSNAKEIQDAYKSLLKVMMDSFDQIWIPEMQTSREYITGPNFDYAQLQNEQRYAMINPLKRFKPALAFIDWEQAILK